MSNGNIENESKKVCEFLSFSPIVLKNPSCYFLFKYYNFF